MSAENDNKLIFREYIPIETETVSEIIRFFKYLELLNFIRENSLIQTIGESEYQNEENINKLEKFCSEVLLLSKLEKNQLLSEKTIVASFFDRVVDVLAFKSEDHEKIRNFLIDLYTSLRMSVSVSRRTTDIYSLSSPYLDELLRSFGYLYPSQIEKLENKPFFQSQLINYYRSKGTGDILRDILTFYGLTPKNSVLNEWWLKEIKGKFYFENTSSWISEENKETLKIQLPYESIVKKDPHWYYDKYDESICDVFEKSLLTLPSITPYVSLTFYSLESDLFTGLALLNRRIQEEYEFWLKYCVKLQNNTNLVSKFDMMKQEEQKYIIKNNSDETITINGDFPSELCNSNISVKRDIYNAFPEFNRDFITRDFQLFNVSCNALESLLLINYMKNMIGFDSVTYKGCINDLKTLAIIDYDTNNGDIYKVETRDRTFFVVKFSNIWLETDDECFLDGSYETLVQTPKVLHISIDETEDYKDIFSCLEYNGNYAPLNSYTRVSTDDTSYPKIVFNNTFETDFSNIKNEISQVLEEDKILSDEQMSIYQKTSDVYTLSEHSISYSDSEKSATKSQYLRDISKSKRLENNKLLFRTKYDSKYTNVFTNFGLYSEGSKLGGMKFFNPSEYNINGDSKTVDITINCEIDNVNQEYNIVEFILDKINFFEDNKKLLEQTYYTIQAKMFISYETNVKKLSLKVFGKNSIISDDETSYNFSTVFDNTTAEEVVTGTFSLPISRIDYIATSLTKIVLTALPSELSFPNMYVKLSIQNISFEIPTNFESDYEDSFKNEWKCYRFITDDTSNSNGDTTSESYEPFFLLKTTSDSSSYVNKEDKKIVFNSNREDPIFEEVSIFPKGNIEVNQNILESKILYFEQDGKTIMRKINFSIYKKTYTDNMYIEVYGVFYNRNSSRECDRLENLTKQVLFKLKIEDEGTYCVIYDYKKLDELYVKIKTKDIIEIKYIQDNCDLVFNNNIAFSRQLKNSSVLLKVLNPNLYDSFKKTIKLIQTQNEYELLYEQTWNDFCSFFNLFTSYIYDLNILRIYLSSFTQYNIIKKVFEFFKPIRTRLLDPIILKLIGSYEIDKSYEGVYVKSRLKQSINSFYIDNCIRNNYLDSALTKLVEGIVLKEYDYKIDNLISPYEKHLIDCMSFKDYKTTEIITTDDDKTDLSNTYFLYSGVPKIETINKNDLIENNRLLGRYIDIGDNTFFVPSSFFYKAQNILLYLPKEIDETTLTIDSNNNLVFSPITSSVLSFTFSDFLIHNNSVVDILRNNKYSLNHYFSYEITYSIEGSSNVSVFTSVYSRSLIGPPYILPSEAPGSSLYSETTENGEYTISKSSLLYTPSDILFFSFKSYTDATFTLKDFKLTLVLK